MTRKPEVIAEAHTRLAVEQQRIEHAGCDRCEGNAWMNCAGPLTDKERAAREMEREIQAAEVRAAAAGWHGYRALPDKPDACNNCGQPADDQIHDVDAMAATC